MLSPLKRTCFITISLVVVVHTQHVAWASHAEHVGQGAIQEAQGKAEVAAKQYEGLVKKGFAQAKILAAAKTPSRCPINQSCFGKKPALGPKSLKQDSGSDFSLDGPVQPIVFVSSSMPKTALQELALEAKKHKARLVLRGMVNNSMKETGNLAKEINHPLDIDPKLFKKYGVSQVPTFAVPYENNEEKDGDDKTGIEWRILRGNINLTYALEKAVGKENNNNNQRISEESSVMFPEEEPR